MTNYYTQFVVAIDNVPAIAKAWAETECPEATFLPEQ